MAVPLWFRRLVLFGTPLVTGTLEITHPAHPFAGPEWWLALHVLQVPLFALLALAVGLLTSGLPGPLPLLSRLAAGVFAAFYIAYDAIAGIANGVIAVRRLALPPEQRTGTDEAIRVLFDSDASRLIVEIGRTALVVAVAVAVVALFRAGAGIAPLALLMVATLVFWRDHVPPTGPLGMYLFFLAALWLEVGLRGRIIAAHPRVAELRRDR